MMPRDDDLRDPGPAWRRAMERGGKEGRTEPIGKPDPPPVPAERRGLVPAPAVGPDF